MLCSPKSHRRQPVDRSVPSYRGNEISSAIPPAAAHKRQLTDKRIGTMTLSRHFQSFVSHLCRLTQPYDDLRWERLQAAFAPTLSQHTQRRWPGLFNPALLKRDQRRNLSLNHFPDSPPSPAPLFVQARPLSPTTPPSAPLHQSGEIGRAHV